MGFLGFLFLLGAVIFVLWVVMGIGALFFGGKDAYKEKLRRMDWEGEVLSRIGDHKHEHYE